jgi:hypothetical protein
MRKGTIEIVVPFSCFFETLVVFIREPCVQCPASRPDR